MSRTKRLSLDNLAPFLLPTPEAPAPLSWKEVFGNDRPVELEVGFGKGLFLLTASLACPDVNFLGIEIVRKYQLFAATRLAKRSLANVRLACADARAFLRDFVGHHSFRAIHVYFPDPWWKKRHRKRRVFTADFAKECARTLQPEGRLHVATDVEEYFGAIFDTVTQNTDLRAVAFPRGEDESNQLEYLTNFERKARLKNCPVFRAVFELGGG